MGYKNLSSIELKNWIKSNKNMLLLDIRTEEEFEEAHIENSINIPLQSLLYNIDELQDYDEKDIVVYCRSGHRSITACNLLSMEGIDKLYNLEDGILGYLK